MNFENDIEELMRKIDNNTQEIKNNLSKIDSNSKQISQNSYALDILKDYKIESKRLFIILIIVLLMWFLTIGYLVYVLNDIETETITTTETYEVEQDADNSGNNNFISGNNNEVK